MIELTHVLIGIRARISPRRDDRTTYHDGIFLCARVCVCARERVRGRRVLMENRLCVGRPVEENHDDSVKYGSRSEQVFGGAR